VEEGVRNFLRVITPTLSPNPRRIQRLREGEDQLWNMLRSWLVLVSVAVSSVVQVGDRDECVWYNALDTISVAALKVALDKQQ